MAQIKAHQVRNLLGVVIADRLFARFQDLRQLLFKIREQEAPGRRHVKDPLVDRSLHLHTGGVEVDGGGPINGRKIVVIVDYRAEPERGPQQLLPAGVPINRGMKRGQLADAPQAVVPGGGPDDPGLQVRPLAEAHLPD